jgi:hypothetical protein
MIYLLILFIGMSSTFSSIKEYKLATSKINFEEKLAERINAARGWSFEKTDSVKGEKGQVCYWGSLSYNGDGQQLKYDVKYCSDSDSLNADEKCLRLYVVGAFDYVNKSGGYKSSDEDVEELMKILDRTLGGLAPDCSEK